MKKIAKKHVTARGEKKKKKRKKKGGREKEREREKQLYPGSFPQMRHY